MSNSYNYANRKLTYEQAEEIRSRYKSDPTLTQKKLAQEYNVSVSTIQGVIDRRNYLRPIPQK